MFQHASFHGYVLGSVTAGPPLWNTLSRLTAVLPRERLTVGY